jgi:hypothetical protein
MLIAVAIVAFTLGLMIEPAIAKLVRHIQLNVHNRKVGKAFRLLEDEGFAVHARDDWAVCKAGSG